MPELPEVETIVRRLKNGTSDQPSVCHQTIESVQITWPGAIATPDPQTFQQSLAGKTIIDAQRRGKYLHFRLNEGHLLGHLRMSGDMHVEERFRPDGKANPPGPYDRVILNFLSSHRMVFTNIRKFGRMWYLNDPQKIFHRLGPEPLDPQFTAQLLYENLQQHSRQIKPLLMDQSFIAGLGNIYTDEALFRSKIHPLRKSDLLSPDEAARLHHSIQTVLQQGILHFGSSLDWFYRGGEFQNDFKVYAQTGRPCPNCGTPIEKMVVGQRGTHICPQCQKYF
jgi:formamidopyrimidine-DNA glycosylase